MSSSNFDHNEVNLFARSADAWWDPNGPHKVLHKINPIRLSFIQKNVTVAQKKCIDIGCGGGLVAEGLAALNASVTAIDMDEVAVEIARKHANENFKTIHYQVATAEHMASQMAEEFDVLTCLEMLEHVPNPVSVVEACAKLVKPNGIIIFSTINRNPIAYLGAIIGAEYLLNLVPKGTHQYQRFIKPSELFRWANDSQLELIEQKGIHYNPITQSVKLSQNLTLNYIAAYRKLV